MDKELPNCINHLLCPMFKTRSNQSPPFSTEAELVSACRAGQSQAQFVLFERYKAKMFAVCLRYIGDRDEAADVLQEGFITVFNKLEQFKGAGSLEGWIRQVMVRTALMHLRKAKMRFEAVDGLGATNDHTTAALSIPPEWPNDTEILLETLSCLPEGCRTVFNLFAIEGYSHAEIAQMLNIAVGTSKSQLSHARQLLQLHLQTIMSHDHTR
jgi:RNA polymerase sigma factor (sigma-70 family)